MKTHIQNYKSSRDSINAGVNQILKDLKGINPISDGDGRSAICPHCNQSHPMTFEFCPLTGKKIVKSSCAPAGTILPISRIFTCDSHVIKNGRVHCIDCNSTNIKVHSRDALQYTCRECGLRFGNGGGENHDARGNKISSYFKIFDIVLGITKKTEINPSIVKHCEDDTSLDLLEDNNILIPSNDGEFLIKKIIFRNDIAIQDSEYLVDSCIPKFYSKLGIFIGANKEDNIKKFLDLGFDIVMFDETPISGPSLRVTLPWSNKYQARLIMDLEYLSDYDESLYELCISVCDK